MIIDAKDLIAGRIGTVAAKKALAGETVSIINAEQAVISGGKLFLLTEFARKKQSKDARKGPFFPRQADRILKRMIRGMLPYKTTHGRAAFSRIKCYIGVPEEFVGKKAETIQGAHVSKLTTPRYMSIRDLSKSIGGMK